MFVWTSQTPWCCSWNMATLEVCSCPCSCPTLSSLMYYQQPNPVSCGHSSLHGYMPNRANSYLGSPLGHTATQTVCSNTSGAEATQPLAGKFSNILSTLQTAHCVCGGGILLTVVPRAVGPHARVYKWSAFMVPLQLPSQVTLPVSDSLVPFSCSSQTQTFVDHQK